MYIGLDDDKTIAEKNPEENDPTVNVKINDKGNAENYIM